MKIPLFLSGVHAGFPSPAEDFIENRLDLNEHLIDHPASTFFVKVVGDSMINAGIHEGDILIVDRSLSARNNNVVIAVLESEFTVKKLKEINKQKYLVPENPNYLRIKCDENVELWGVVTYVIHGL